MTEQNCPEPGHNNNLIRIHDFGEEDLFIDDNRREVAIFTTEEGVKYLKRFIIGECDESCPTIQGLLGP